MHKHTCHMDRGLGCLNYPKHPCYSCCLMVTLWLHYTLQWCFLNQDLRLRNDLKVSRLLLLLLILCPFHLYSLSPLNTSFVLEVKTATVWHCIMFFVLNTLRYILSILGTLHTHDCYCPKGISKETSCSHDNHLWENCHILLLSAIYPLSQTLTTFQILTVWGTTEIEWFFFLHILQTFNYTVHHNMLLHTTEENRQKSNDQQPFAFFID